MTSADGRRPRGPRGILILCRHRLVRDGLSLLAGRDGGARVVAAAAGGEAVEDLPPDAPPDVVVLADARGGVRCADQVRRVKADHATLPVLVLSADVEPSTVQDVVAAGATAFLPLDVDPDDLVRAVRTSARGELTLHRSIVPARPTSPTSTRSCASTPAPRRRSWPSGRAGCPEGGGSVVVECSAPGGSPPPAVAVSGPVDAGYHERHLMTRRTRFTAGLCALLALTFSVAESVWASTCAMPMAGGMGQVHDTASDIPSGPHCATHQGQGTDHDGPDDEPCPFSSPLAAQACVGVVSLPTRSAVLPAAASEAVDELLTLDVRPGLLLETSLFRPPRA